MDFSDVKIIGLTGMSGAGKTTAGDIFLKRGFFIINCDEEAGKIISKLNFLNEVSRYFCPEAVVNNKLDRKKVAEIIFTNFTQKQKYEKLIFPYITYSILKRIENEIKNKSSQYILLDAPTLFESRIYKICDLIVSVVTDYNSSIDRIIKRDRILHESAENRLKSQNNMDFYISRSDYSILNDKSKECFENDINNIINKICAINNKV